MYLVIPRVIHNDGKNLVFTDYVIPVRESSILWTTIFKHWNFMVLKEKWKQIVFTIQNLLKIFIICI